ncbi:MAG: Uroporphyrin-III C-methyltransferase [Friedmanniella sp.]|nr:Uroporphyrin-III C-methyltransferase [Friedmanniella sp.]
MKLDLDVRSRKVVVFGDPVGARRAVRRFHRNGATVTLVSDTPAPPPEARLDTVRYVNQPRTGDPSALLRLVGPAWLVVLVGTAPGLRLRVSDLSRRLRVLLVTEEPAEAEGRVTLVGGGPGRPGLLTGDAVAALAAADVVFFDRLGPTTDLETLAPAAELYDVGKSPADHTVGQRAIEGLMIARARAGQTVVRLKGGDPFVFGRGGEEMTACVAAGVPVHVVPGVSSSIAVPGACGIPVTHRGLSHAFTAISGHVAPSRDELAALVQLRGTIVVLMGIANLGRIVAGLLDAGLDPGIPAAIIERGFSDSQRSTFTTAGRLPAEADRLGVRSPAVVVIGDVVTVAPAYGRTADLDELGPGGPDRAPDGVPQW